MDHFGPPRLAMMLQQHSITSACGGYTRDIWLLPSPRDEAHALYLFLDGEYYLRDVEALPIVVELMETGAIPRGACAFVSHASRGARHIDYLCNVRYARFIAADVVAWAKSQSPGLCERNHLIAGLSLSGLAAAHIVCHWPAVFSYCLAQSGSFWWLAQNNIALPPTTARFWLSVGDEETATGLTHPPSGLRQDISQIDGVQHAAKCLSKLGATTHWTLYAGGHAASAWSRELGPSLRWLMLK